MAKYECKVCGYIYNEQHASRSFEELTECPICNEGKENFVALDADNNPVAEAKEEVKEENIVAKAEDAAADDFFTEAKEEEDVVVEESQAEEAKEEPFAMYKEVKEEAEENSAPASDFVVERRQDFWTPVSANEKKEEPENHNTTGWTISNAMGSVEKVIGGEEAADEVKETVTEVMEEDDMPVFNSRIESFYSSAEPVRTSHIISGDEEEERFKPLWNAGGGTVQRVIDPFNDKNDSVVKAENIGMVMPAEEPVVEEILGEEEGIEDVAEAMAEENVAEEVAENVEEMIENAEDVAEAVQEDAEAVADFAEEESAEAVVEFLDEEVEDSVEEVIQEATPDEPEVFAEEAAEEVIETATEEDFLDDDDDDFFTEMTMDAVMAEDVHHHGDSGISEDEVFEAIDAIVFDDEVPEGGRIEVVSADGTEVIDWEDVETMDVAEEAAEVVAEEAEAVTESAEDEIPAAEAEEFFFDDDEAEGEIAEEVPAEEVNADAYEDAATDEPATEPAEEEIAEATEEINVVSEEEDDEPFVFEEIDEIAQATEDDFESETFVFEDAEEDVLEEVKEDILEDTAPVEAVEEAEEAIETVDEVREAAVEEVAEEVAAEDNVAAEPVVKGWSFLDDVVEAGVATGATVAGVNFVTKAMDEVVDEEVTDEDIEEVFVDFGEEVKADANEYDFKATLAEELFAQEPAEFKEDVPLAEQCDNVEAEKVSYCNNLEKILIVPAQLNPMPLPEGTEVEGRTVLGIASERPLVLDNPVFSTGDYNMVQYIPNSGLTSEDYQKADAIEVIVGHGNGIEKTINSKEDLRQVVNFLRLESDGCPIGIKMGAARIERDLEFCVFAKPDYVVLNNFDVVPLPYALHRATKYLNTVQSDMDIVIALDGAKDAEELAKIMAMGADVIALRNRPDDMVKMTEGLKKYARITGHYDVEDLNVKDLCTVDREIAEYTDIYHV